MLKYSIEGGSLPVVICYPQMGQTICTERGSMSWMSPNMVMETNSGGGFGKAFGRMLSGDSLFINEFTPQGGEGMIAFASSFPGSIIPLELHNESIIVQKQAFLAMEKGLDLSMHFQKKIGKGLFGGEGFIMQKISGTGVAFIEIDGYCKIYELRAGESLVLDTGYLAAMSESCTMEIQTVKGIKNMLLGGEGFFNTVVRGPGRVYVQSMPMPKTAAAIAPYIVTSN
ncbi:MAG: TIGR00266 family protein [Ruminococcus sp.]|nr:TIGR00266 family protein [Ruminococcus sp.]